MRILVDTNVLIRLFQASNPVAPIADLAIRQLLTANFIPCLLPQNLYELWAVATRPAAQNGFGMTCLESDQLVKKCLAQFRLMRDERGVFDLWMSLVLNHQVQGKNSHDARLVAAMLKHTIPYILTFNTADFKRYAVQSLDPSMVANGSLPTTP
jgi:predicted nucleic acid-binding protein